MGARYALRRPEYTGQRRCWACTVVNLVLVAVGAIAGWLLGGALVGTGVVVLGVAAVALRGYVVPYTPRFAPVLVDAIPLVSDWFDPDPERGSSAGSLTGSGLDDLDEEAILASLVEHGVVIVDGAELYLAPTFRERWEDEIRDLRDTSIDDLANAVDSMLPRFDVVVERPASEPMVVITPPGGGVVDEIWRTRPVALAEVAAAQTLPDDLEPVTRLAAAEPLRMFLEVCPACGGSVEETTTVACCGGAAGARSDPDEVLACADCGTRLFTFPE